MTEPHRFLLPIDFITREGNGKSGAFQAVFETVLFRRAKVLSPLRRMYRIAGRIGGGCRKGFLCQGIDVLFDQIGEFVVSFRPFPVAVKVCFDFFR